MSKKLLLAALLFIGSLAFAQTKEHKTMTEDIESPGYGFRDDRIPCVLTMSYYENEGGNVIYDGPFSVIGKENVPSAEYRAGLGAGRVDVMYEMRGNFSDGLLDGKYSLTATYNFKSNKGAEAPNKWVKTGYFNKGVPAGDWDYLQKRSTTNGIETYTIHVTIQDGKPVGDFYSHGFEVDNIGKTENGKLVSYEERFRGETSKKYVFYKGVDISANSDIGKKYADGTISIDELENNGYYVDRNPRSAFSESNSNEVLRALFDDFKEVFGKSFQEKCLDERYRDYENWVRITIITIKENSVGFWSPSRVNTFMSQLLQRADTYSRLIDCYYDLDSHYNTELHLFAQEIKTVHYNKIKAALDEKKLVLEKDYVEGIKNEIDSKTSMFDLAIYWVGLNNEKKLETLSAENREAVETFVDLKYNTLEKKEIEDVLSTIHSCFDRENMDVLSNKYGSTDNIDRVVFHEGNLKRIDEALGKQPVAIETSLTLKKALDQIVLVSQDKKITKKPDEVIANDYNSNATKWEVFSCQSVQQLSEKVVPFCPMSSYQILSADYLEDGGFVYTVRWTKQLSKKEQKKYTSEFVVLKDKKHVDINSFDFTKVKE